MSVSLPDRTTFPASTCDTATSAPEVLDPILANFEPRIKASHVTGERQPCRTCGVPHRLFGGLAARAGYFIARSTGGACAQARSGLSRGLPAVRSLRLAAQDVALSRRKQGFESP